MAPLRRAAGSPKPGCLRDFGALRAPQRQTGCGLIITYSKVPRIRERIYIYIYVYRRRHAACHRRPPSICICRRHTVQEHKLEAALTGRVEQRCSCLVTFSAGACAGASENALFLCFILSYRLLGTLPKLQHPKSPNGQGRMPAIFVFFMFAG